MGGPGSGRRWHHGAADCTDDYRRLDVRRWQRDGFLTPGRAFAWQGRGRAKRWPPSAYARKPIA